MHVAKYFCVLSLITVNVFNTGGGVTRVPKVLKVLISTDFMNGTPKTDICMKNLFLFSNQGSGKAR